ncbi:benzoate/H(+) symporter BenE family transporter, partial [Escherichia coli]|nr:benzoate/H(+) symporter BenE family transporter [Escherichia coli]
DPNQRWLAAIAAGGFYLLAGLFGGSITALMSALPPAWIQMLAGLALVGCDQKGNEAKHIKVGVINGAEQDVAEVAK